jgi:hypothetical protein
MHACTVFILDTIPDSIVTAMCGIDRWTFLTIYQKYCGPRTPIDSHVKLFRLFSHFKLYPVSLSLKKHIGTKGIELRKHAAFLARVIDEFTPAWQSRVDECNLIPHYFQDGVVGSIDTFPVYVVRPAHPAIQSCLYNGKYKGHVYKVQPCNMIRSSHTVNRSCILIAHRISFIVDRSLLYVCCSSKECVPTTALLVIFLAHT